jgi:hypothetical protein
MVSALRPIDDAYSPDELNRFAKAVMTKLGLTINEAKNFVEKRPTGTLRLSRLLVRGAFV